MDVREGKLKAVWGRSDRAGRTTWSRTGVAWEGADGTLFVRLDALPLSGQLCVRPWSPGDDEAGPSAGREEDRSC